LHKPPNTREKGVVFEVGKLKEEVEVGKNEKKKRKR
jgi:hypothetical protein